VNPLGDLSAVVQSVSDASAEQRRQLEAELAATESRLSRRLETQQESLAAAEGALGRLQIEAAGRRPDELAWRLVEAEYLLRLADHRGRLDADANGARILLVAADAVLADAEDAAAAEVRGAGAEGIRLLDAAQPLDARRIHGELEEIQRRIETLPFRLPEFEPGASADAEETPPAPEAALATPVPDEAESSTGAAESTAAAEASDSAWQRTLGRIGSLFDFRRRDVTVPPPILRPDEERYLRMNLALTIEEAQVALARRDDAMLDASLATVLESIGRFMEMTDERVIEVRQHLEQLRALDVGAPLPDFSRALTLLQRRVAVPAPAGVVESSESASRAADASPEPEASQPDVVGDDAVRDDAVRGEAVP
jgi:uroporphyrin-3 C-methyltransferase